jgi:hypothetical protein
MLDRLKSAVPLLKRIAVFKACGDIPVKLAESIAGHSRGGSDFDHYGTVDYSLEQKLAYCPCLRM